MVDQPHDHLPPAAALLPRNHRRAALVAGGVVVGWAAFNFFWSLGDHPFYFPGELANAQAARAGEPASLIGHIRQFTANLRQVDELSLRLPSAVFAVAIALLAGFINTKLRDALTGVITVLLMLVNPLVALAGRVAIDLAWLIPLAMAPLSMGLAIPVRRWLDDGSDRARRPLLLWGVVVLITLSFAAAIVCFTVRPVYQRFDFDPAIAPLMMRMLLQGLVCVVGAWAALKLFGTGRRRVWAMVLLGLSLSCTVTVGVSVEDALTRRHSTKALVLKVQNDLGQTLEQITLVGVDRAAFDFYSAAHVDVAGDFSDVTVAMAIDVDKPRLWVIADPNAQLDTDAPGAFEWRRPFERWVAILQRPAPPLP